MNPAPSIVLFTTASGTGYGMLFWLGLLRPLGLLPPSDGFALAALALALVLVTVGLLSSTAHLGRPERAWRAVTQWRSSWLSREGIAALATYPAAGLFGLAILIEWNTIAALLGLLSAGLAAITVYCTGMIYASIRPVRQWRHPLVVPGYLLLGSFGGALVLAMAASWWDGAWAAALIASLAGVGGIALKSAYWRAIDSEPASASTRESATGLGAFGTVRTLDPPHTETNYLLREMAFRIARKHAERLREIALAAGFAMPAALALLALLTGGTAAAVLLSGAVVLGAIGLLIERWLMFAEATHTVALYYPTAAERPL